MNMLSMLDERAGSDRSALVHRGRTITFRELAEEAARFHAGLVELGIGPGDRVMIFAGTTPWFVTALFGTLHAGAVAVPANPLSPPPEMSTEMAAVRPALVVVGPAAAASIAECAIDAPVVALPGANVADAIAYEDFLGEPGRTAVERESDDLAMLLFTSGTAGSPKAAMLTHRNLVSNLEQVHGARSELVDRDDVGFGVLPMFHILGLNALFTMVLFNGGSMVLVERFDPLQSVALVRDHQVTVVSGPPAMWKAWADHPEIGRDDFASVRIGISGAAGLGREVANAVQERLGVRLSQGYGLTEAAPVLTLGAGTGAPSTSVGRPVPGVELRLVDPAGNDVPVGDEGEILARGANVFSGYWENEAATAEVLTPDGWLRTGDVGVVDDDGYLYIVDRTKDLIMVSGFNVFPGEVEGVLGDHPGIAEAAVIGVRDAVTGEAVKAFVVAADDAVLDQDEIIAFCADRMARYKCPSSVEIVDELPRGSALGKMRRRELRAADAG
jgi:long-chain acyl-CoA synthetase